jgi:NDP-sugar pyrophosphorylase family protein
MNCRLPLLLSERKLFLGKHGLQLAKQSLGKEICIGKEAGPLFCTVLSATSETFLSLQRGLHHAVVSCLLRGHVRNVGGHAGAVVRDALLCDGVKVGEGCQVTRGAVLGPGCVISSGHTTPPHARSTLCTRAEVASQAEADAVIPKGRVMGIDDSENDHLLGPTEAILQVCLL